MRTVTPHLHIVIQQIIDHASVVPHQPPFSHIILFVDHKRESTIVFFLFKKKIQGKNTLKLTVCASDKQVVMGIYQFEIGSLLTSAKRKSRIASFFFFFFISSFIRLAVKKHSIILARTTGQLVLYSFYGRASAKKDGSFDEIVRDTWHRFSDVTEPVSPYSYFNSLLVNRDNWPDFSSREKKNHQLDVFSSQCRSLERKRFQDGHIIFHVPQESDGSFIVAFFPSSTTVKHLCVRKKEKKERAKKYRIMQTTMKALVSLATRQRWRTIVSRSQTTSGPRQPSQCHQQINLYQDAIYLLDTSSFYFQNKEIPAFFSVAKRA